MPRTKTQKEEAAAVLVGYFRKLHHKCGLPFTQEDVAKVEDAVHDLVAAAVEAVHEDARKGDW